MREREPHKIIDFTIILFCSVAMAPVSFFGVLCALVASVFLGIRSIVIYIIASFFGICQSLWISALQNSNKNDPEQPELDTTTIFGIPLGAHFPFSPEFLKNPWGPSRMTLDDFQMHWEEITHLTSDTHWNLDLKAYLLEFLWDSPVNGWRSAGLDEMGGRGPKQPRVNVAPQVKVPSASASWSFSSRPPTPPPTPVSSTPVSSTPATFGDDWTTVTSVDGWTPYTFGDGWVTISSGDESTPSTPGDRWSDWTPVTSGDDAVSSASEDGWAPPTAGNDWGTLPSADDWVPLPSGNDGAPSTSGDAGVPSTSAKDHWAAEAPLIFGFDWVPLPSGDDGTHSTSGDDWVPSTSAEDHWAAESPLIFGCDWAPLPSGDWAPSTSGDGWVPSKSAEDHWAAESPLIFGSDWAPLQAWSPPPALGEVWTRGPETYEQHDPTPWIMMPESPDHSQEEGEPTPKRWRGKGVDRTVHPNYYNPAHAENSHSVM